MSKLLRTISLEKLQSSEASIARVWRAVSVTPGISAEEIAEGLGVNLGLVQKSLERLKKLSWVLVAKRDMDRRFRYVAQDDGETGATEHIGERLKGIRSRLTRLASDARAARRTGLGIPMGNALADIEKALIEIKDELYVRR